ncbi:hypothetical cytosolic protein [Syntrophus aciditrophicus SB]|uniref:Hypothetical cytosolic protein n=1 Tax=Syntrophus aciditrophicus (strain SB) TaxID=56780 RepID=Q2LUI8_SYNAS|nr:hypothetical cytosolic protein [Syntrophus aciditrophicus SB]
MSVWLREKKVNTSRRILAVALKKWVFSIKIIIGVNAATEQRPVDGILNSAGAVLFQVEVSGRNRVIDAM